MPTRVDAESQLFDPAYLWILRLWILRAMMRCNGVAQFLDERRFHNLPVAQLLGFSDKQISAYAQPWALQTLQTKLELLEQAPPPLPGDTILAQNLAQLAQRLALNGVECDVLHLVAAMRDWRQLSWPPGDNYLGRWRRGRLLSG
jgi:hypothetical protein